MIDDLFKLTVSSLFLLYPLGIQYQGLKGLGFLNAYLRDEDSAWEGDVVLLLFKPSHRDRFQFFVEKEKARTEQFIDEYDYEGGFTVLVYQFPEALKDDLEKIKEGRYSKLSTAYIDTIPPAVKIRQPNGGVIQSPPATWMIIHKSPQWVEMVEESLGMSIDPKQEFWLKMDIKSKETLDIARIKEEIKANKLILI